jgi:hypothetical protein
VADELVADAQRGGKRGGVSWPAGLLTVARSRRDARPLWVGQRHGGIDAAERYGLLCHVGGANGLSWAPSVRGQRYLAQAGGLLATLRIAETRWSREERRAA